MKTTTVTVLSMEQLKERYCLTLPNTRMDRLTKEALDKGYSIACIEKEGLRREKRLFYRVQVALEQSVPRSSVIKLGCYTDMSQLGDDKIYVAFKELKNQACAHSSAPEHCRISN